MTKKTQETLDEAPAQKGTPLDGADTAKENRYDTAARYSALEMAISHHKTNGGMLTAPQLIDNAKYFHAYLTGENK